MNGIDVAGNSEKDTPSLDGEKSENIVVLPLNEDSKKITQTLSNEKSLKILDLLSEEPMSANDVAKKLGLSITTVKYNIDSLLEADLIKVNRIKWSEKGREVKLYEPVQKLIIVAPGNMNVNRASIISMLQQYVGIIGAAFLGAAGLEFLARPIVVENQRAFSEPLMMNAVMEEGEVTEMAADAMADMPVAAMKEVANGGQAAEPASIFDNISNYLSNLSDHAGLWFFFGCLFAVMLMMLKGRYYDVSSASTKKNVKLVLVPLLVIGLLAATFSIAYSPDQNEQFLFPEIDKLPADTTFTYIDSGSTAYVAAGSLIRVDMDSSDGLYWYLSEKSDLVINESGPGYSSVYSEVTDDSVYGWTFEAASLGEKTIKVVPEYYVEATSDAELDTFELALIVKGDKEVYPSLIFTDLYNENVVELNKGERFLIDLYEYDHEESVWNVTTSDGLTIINDQFIPEYEAASYGKHKWTVEAVASGSQNISLVQVRPDRELTGYERTFELELNVL